MPSSSRDHPRLISALFLGLVLSPPTVCAKPHEGLQTPKGVGLSSPGRRLPDTKRGVHVWADQLHYDRSNRGIHRFVAENFVGTQKITRDRIDPIRAFNPDFVVLQYHPAYGSGLNENITDALTWSQDVAELQRFVARNPRYGPEEQYYIHWTRTEDPAHRVRHYWRGIHEWNLADVTHPGWQHYVIEESIRRARVVGFDGTFFDVAHEPLYGYEPDADKSSGGKMWYTYPPHSWPNVHALAAGWNARVVPYFRKICEAYHADGRNLLCLPNCGRMITGWYEPEWMSVVDGGMVEGWFTGINDPSDWALSAQRILKYLSAPGKIIIAQPAGSKKIAKRVWWVAHYFLLKNQRTYLYYAHSKTPYWWAEYDIDLGEYLREPPASLGALKRPSGVYARDYTGGLVLVNPTAKPITTPLKRAYREVTFSGYGKIVGYGKPEVSVKLGAAHTGQVTLAPQSALILAAAK